MAIKLPQMIVDDSVKDTAHHHMPHPEFSFLGGVASTASVSGCYFLPFRNPPTMHGFFFDRGALVRDWVAIGMDGAQALRLVVPPPLGDPRW